MHSSVPNHKTATTRVRPGSIKLQLEKCNNGTKRILLTNLLNILIFKNALKLNRSLHQGDGNLIRTYSVLLDLE